MIVSMFTESELRILNYLSEPVDEQSDYGQIYITPEIKEELLDMERKQEEELLNKLYEKYDTFGSRLLLENLKYIKAYCNKHPVCYDGCYQLLNAPYGYFWSKEMILLELKITEEKFYKFTLLQEAISALGLEPQPTFEFIAFLLYHIRSYSEKREITGRQKITNVLTTMNNCSETENISMVIKVGSESIEFHNSLFIKSILGEYYRANTKSQQLIEVETKKRQQRIIQYSLLKTLLNELPYKVEKAEGVKYTQSERNFCLCVLRFCKLLKGEVEFVCTKENNATFDKLMRDFAGTETNSFLTITF